MIVLFSLFSSLMKVVTFLLFFFILCQGSVVWNERFWTRSSRVVLPSEPKRLIVGVKLKKGAAATCESATARIHREQLPHLSFAQVGNMFRNRVAERRALRWLQEGGFHETELSLAPNGETIRVVSTVAKVEQLLRCKLAAFTSADKTEILRDLNWTLPQGLGSFVDFIDGIDLLPTPRAVVMRARPLNRSRQTGSVTPYLLNSVYNISGIVTHPNATQSVFESLGQSFSVSDLAAFDSQFNLLFSPPTVVGPNNPTECSSNANNCAEASLDVQWISAVAQNASTYFWSVRSVVFEDMFVEFVDALLRDASPPLVHSISYGSLAPETFRFNVERFNVEACKLGLRGITLVVASGDDGVANFWARDDPAICLVSPFTPSFPATST